MDLKLLVGFIYNHYIVVFGSTLAVFFTICMILLIRSIGSKNETEEVADLKAIEGAMRRVLQSQPVNVVAGARLPASANEQSENTEDQQSETAGKSGQASSEDLTERDAKIEELSKDLEAARAALNAADGEDPAKIALREEITGLTTKMEEMSARLAEYEIIEDDIADLSMFKDENASLKKEVETLKTQLASAPAAASASSSEVSTANPLVAEAEAVAASSEAKVEENKVSSNATFDLGADDDVMKQFASAVGSGAAVETLAPVEAQAPAPVETSAPAPGDEAELLNSQAEIDALLSGQGISATPITPTAETESVETANDVVVDGVDASINTQVSEDSAQATASASSNDLIDDPLAGDPDPDKMLTEIEKIGSSESAGDAALDDSLDTDKLLAEVDSLKDGVKTA